LSHSKKNTSVILAEPGSDSKSTQNNYKLLGAERERFSSLKQKE
jgi:hypothetical protein